MTIAELTGGNATATKSVTTYTATPAAPVTITYQYADAQGQTQTGTATETSRTFKVGDTYTSGAYTGIITALSGGTTATATVTTAATASPTSPVTVTMSDGTQATYTSGSYTVGHSMPVTTTITVHDSLGTAHNIPVLFEKDGTDNEWLISLGKTAIQESDGSYTEVSMAPGTGSTTTTVNFDDTGKYKSGAVVLTLKYSNVNTVVKGKGANGAQDSQKVTLNLSQLTQYAGSSTINATPDGNAAGTLSSVSVDSSGIITGTYTNGVKQQEAQVAVAQFTNASGLTKTGNSLYQESNNSGVANVKSAADLGVTITPSALEMSNVDIANEFSDMIITQRGFQSNSKIITVGDEMLETVINMKR